MKVVLFAGGRGLRMRDGGEDVPKPLAVLGGRPLLWHVMNWYAAQGHTEFVLCLGYRADDVRRVIRAEADPAWKVECVDTGLDTPLGQRLVRVREHVAEEEMFLANYADVLSDVRVADIVEQLVLSDATAALLAVRPQASFHLVQMTQDGVVTGVGPVTDAPMWQNGGFFVLRQGIFDVIGPGEELVDEPFARLSLSGKLLAHRWDGFWAPLDTQKDRQRLEALHAAARHPWEIPQPVSA